MNKTIERLSFMLLGAILVSVAYFVGIADKPANAQKSNETPNADTSTEGALSGYTGLFDKDSTPKNYLSNGDFYSQDKPRRLPIDLGLIDKVQSAIWWYDKAITEYPGTQEASIALTSKIRTLIGWTEGYGKDKKAYGLHGPPSKVHNGYFALAESTFLELEVGYPDNEYLDALAFQIAQQYLFHALVNRKAVYKEDCKRWFEKTIKLAKGADTFYSHLARLRLTLVE